MNTGHLLCLVSPGERGTSGFPTPQAWHWHPNLDEEEEEKEGGDCGDEGAGGRCRAGAVQLSRPGTPVRLSP